MEFQNWAVFVEINMINFW